jgi:hypothetical protein
MNNLIYQDVIENIRESEDELEPSHTNIAMEPFTTYNASSKAWNVSRQAIGAISATPTKDLLSNTSRRRLWMDSELDGLTCASTTPQKRQALMKESETTRTETASVTTKGGNCSFALVAISGGRMLNDEICIAMCHLGTSECILSQVGTRILSGMIQINNYFKCSLSSQILEITVNYYRDCIVMTLWR